MVNVSRENARFEISQRMYHKPSILELRAVSYPFESTWTILKRVGNNCACL